jgi:hypothetical protein
MIEQIAIALCGITSIYLSQDSRASWRRYACIFGICAQPFWLYATWRAGQWGMFALTIAYTIGWMRGIRNFWWRKVSA